MTNIEKIKRILDAGHWVKATWSDGEINIITSYKENINEYDSYSFINNDGCIECDVDICFNNCTAIEVIQRIPTPYQSGDKVLVLSNPSKDNKAKEAMVGKICEIKDAQCGYCYHVWNEDKTDYLYFPSYCLAPVFDDEEISDTNRIISGKEVTVTIEGKEYTCVIK